MALSVRTGRKIYNTLTQYSSLTGEPTGVTKPNIPSDPDYVPPVIDHTSCPPSTSITGYGLIKISSEYNLKDLRIKVVNKSTSAVVFDKTWQSSLNEFPINEAHSIPVTDKDYEVWFDAATNDDFNFRIFFDDTDAVTITSYLYNGIGPSMLVKAIGDFSTDIYIRVKLPD